MQNTEQALPDAATPAPTATAAGQAYSYDDLIKYGRICWHRARHTTGDCEPMPAVSLIEVPLGEVFATPTAAKDAPSPSQRMRDAGFTPRDRRLTCDECGAQYTAQFAPLHKCPDAARDQSDTERDAARYRWLVDNSFDRQGVTQFHVWRHTWEPHSETLAPTEWKSRVRGPALDRAIDAAMGAEGSKG